LFVVLYFMCRLLQIYFYLFYFFFFFKQKTAYEITRRDWSSDVCSSDLLDGKLYLTTRHRGILTYDPQTKALKTLVYTYRNQLFKGPNDLDFDAEGNLFFTDPWATGPGPNMSDHSGAVYQYSKDGILRKVMDSLNFPNGIAVSPDNNTLAIGDCTAGRMLYAAFAA